MGSDLSEYGPRGHVSFRGGTPVARRKSGMAILAMISFRGRSACATATFIDTSPSIQLKWFEV